MKIIYFSQFYTPESIAPSFRATENSNIWTKHGHKVTVFTGYPNYPKGKIYDGYNPKLLTIETINGVKVLRSKLVAKPNTSIVRRLENALSYFFFGLINICYNHKVIERDYDVVLGTSGVVFNALLAYIYAKMHRIPFVFEIRDITYVQMQATGKKDSDFTVKCMKWLELFLCQKAKKIVVVTNGFKRILVSEGIRSEKIEVITNGVDVDQAMGMYEIENSFILSYFGTIGISQNIIETFQYAEFLSEIISEFQYLIIGDGAQRTEIQKISEKKKYIKMLPGVSSKELEPYYGSTQMSVITLRKSDNFKYTIPSKLFQIMGRGIAVLYIGPEGEAADIIRKYEAGIVLTQSDEKNVEVLKEFFSDQQWKAKLQLLGKNGRKAVEMYYSRSKLAEDYLSILNAARKEECMM